jgi:hypothetical protein
MAKIWKVREGAEPTIGDPWLERPLDACVQALSLKKAHFVKALPKEGEIPAGPRFGDAEDHLSGFREPSIVVVEVSEDEAQKSGWRAGFYCAPLTVREVEARFR